MRCWSVNFICALLLVLTGCGPSPRSLPPLPPADPAPAFLPQQPRLAWSRDTGSGLIAPLTARGSALFATTTNRLVVALGNQDGRRYWYQRFDAPISTGVRIDGNRVFFATAALRGQAVALDATRGRKVWSRRIGSTHLPPLMQAGQIY
ncbi:MAG TPA: PQQ-binding-like beta-propeller repeat protein, partial [Longimicrobiales bacterium]|nr:PQQ-binding-like beta-propeller repeat protein [Longimicrobiales bacterium]